MCRNMVVVRQTTAYAAGHIRYNAIEPCVAAEHRNKDIHIRSISFRFGGYFSDVVEVEVEPY